MRLTEFFQTIPAFVLAILIVAILSPSLSSEVVAIVAVSWPGIARLVRGEFVALGGREFVLACDGLGAGDARIVFRHMLPNCTAADHRGRHAPDRHGDPDRGGPRVSWRATWRRPTAPALCSKRRAAPGRSTACPSNCAAARR